MSDPIVTNKLVPTKLIAPGVHDDRQVAFVGAMDAHFQSVNISKFIMVDAWKVDAELLPALAVETAVQKYLTPDMPEKVVRGLIANSYELHAKEGYVEGTRLGLSLLGAKVKWVQWHQMSPMGAPNTHTVTVYVNEQIFDDEPTLLNQRVQRAALKIIDATKRWSQETSFQIGAGFDSERALSGGSTAMGFAQDDFDASPDTGLSTDVAPIDCATGLQFGLKSVSATPNLDLASHARLADASTTIQFQTLSMEAA